jgi:hypothetical protein
MLLEQFCERIRKTFSFLGCFRHTDLACLSFVKRRNLIIAAGTCLVHLLDSPTRVFSGRGLAYHCREDTRPCVRVIIVVLGCRRLEAQPFGLKSEVYIRTSSTKLLMGLTI